MLFNFGGVVVMVKDFGSASRCSLTMLASVANPPEPIRHYFQAGGVGSLMVQFMSCDAAGKLQMRGTPSVPDGTSMQSGKKLILLLNYSYTSTDITT